MRSSWNDRNSTRTIRSLVYVALCATLTIGSPAAEARMFGDVEFAEIFETEHAPLSLRGVGRVYFMRFFEVYVGGLYLPRSVSADEVLSDVPKRLELHYTRKITAAQFAEAADEFLERNLTSDENAAIASRVAMLNRTYRDVAAGDSYSLTYLPGVGTELALNGETLITIEGQDFGSAYLSIWLGKRSLSEDFRDAVLDR